MRARLRVAEGVPVSSQPLADPFALLADPDLYVERPATERALDELERGVLLGEAPVALFGPPGMGKTLLLRVLAKRLAGSFRAAYLPYPLLAPRDLCRWALMELDELPTDDPEAALLKAARRGPDQDFGVLLLIDDADALPLRTGQRLFEMVQASGGDLRVVLAAADHARAWRVFEQAGVELSVVQLSEPMTRDETGAYLRAMLVRFEHLDPVARGRFDASAIDALHVAAEGVPGLVQVAATEVLRGGPAPPPREAIHALADIEEEVAAPVPAPVLVPEPLAAPSPAAAAAAAAAAEPAPEPVETPAVEAADAPTAVEETVVAGPAEPGEEDATPTAAPEPLPEPTEEPTREPVPIAASQEPAQEELFAEEEPDAPPPEPVEAPMTIASLRERRAARLDEEREERGGPDRRLVVAGALAAGLAAVALGVFLAGPGEEPGPTQATRPSVDVAAAPPERRPTAPPRAPALVVPVPVDEPAAEAPDAPSPETSGAPTATPSAPQPIAPAPVPAEPQSRPLPPATPAPEEPTRSDGSDGKVVVAAVETPEPVAEPTPGRVDERESAPVSPSAAESGTDVVRVEPEPDATVAAPEVPTTADATASPPEEPSASDVATPRGEAGTEPLAEAEPVALAEPQRAPGPNPAPPAAGYVAVDIEAPVGARVEIDGRSIGEAPISQAPVQVGRRRIVVRLEDGGVMQRTVEISAQRESIVFY